MTARPALAELRSSLLRAANMDLISSSENGCVHSAQVVSDSIRPGNGSRGIFRSHSLQRITGSAMELGFSVDMSSFLRRRSA